MSFMVSLLCAPKSNGQFQKNVSIERLSQNPLNPPKSPSDSNNQLGSIFAGNLASMATGGSKTSFKEYLEEQMDLKRPCTIRFRDVQGAVTQIKGRIVKMEEVSDREIIETDAGFVIGMDQVISVNDRPQENYC